MTTVQKQDVFQTDIPNDIALWVYGGNARYRVPTITCTRLAKELLFDIFTDEFKRFNRLRRPSLEEFPKAMLDTRYTIVLFAFLWAHSMSVKEFEGAGHYMAYIEKASGKWLNRNPPKSYARDAERKPRKRTDRVRS